MRAMTDHPAVANYAPMRSLPRRVRGIRVGTAAWSTPVLIDRVVDTYVEWRESTGLVGDAYGRWCRAPAVEDGRRFAAYLAALDQEQTAAAVYAESIGDLARRLWSPD
jgi:hypothetical protein